MTKTIILATTRTFLPKLENSRQDLAMAKWVRVSAVDTRLGFTSEPTSFECRLSGESVVAME